MSRIIAALIGLVVVLAACGVEAGPTRLPSSPATPSESAPPSATPVPTVAPGASGTPEPAPAEPSFGSWDGHPAAGLAFARVLDPSDPVTQIFVVEADGTPRQLTGVTASLGASYAVWAPDGSRLAFTGPKHGETTVTGMLAVVNADGSDEREIADGQFPRWSPDGVAIAFQEVDDVTGEDLSMYLVDPDSGEITDLGIGYSPRWIEGGRVVFNGNTYAADGLATSALYVMDLESGQVDHVADWTEAFPSLDGSRVALVHEGVVSVAEAGDMADAREIAGGSEVVWSPDGTRLAVSYDVDADANPVWAVVDLEGRELGSGIVGATPTWSPDGTRLALEVYRPAMPVIQVVELATGQVVWEEEGRQPAWRP